MYIRKLQTLMLELVVLTTLLLFAGVAHASTVLFVNVSDPTAVVFTANPQQSENFIEMVPSGEGILLKDFFTLNVGTLDEGLDSGTIDVQDVDTGAGTFTRSPLDKIFVGTAPAGGDATPSDLVFYNNAAPFEMFFYPSVEALSGSASQDVSSLTGLPTVGMSGNIFAGGLGPRRDVVGQWRVVPEPSSVSLVALGALLLAARRRRR